MTLNVMVWRIHFSEDDLARIQVSPTMGPLAETVLAAALLRGPQQPRTLLSEWRGQVTQRAAPGLRSVERGLRRAVPGPRPAPSLEVDM